MTFETVARINLGRDHDRLRRCPDDLSDAELAGFGPTRAEALQNFRDLRRELLRGPTRTRTPASRRTPQARPAARRPRCRSSRPAADDPGGEPPLPRGLSADARATVRWVERCGGTLDAGALAQEFTGRRDYSPEDHYLARSEAEDASLLVCDGITVRRVW